MPPLFKADCLPYLHVCTRVVRSGCACACQGVTCVSACCGCIVRPVFSLAPKLYSGCNPHSAQHLARCMLSGTSCVAAPQQRTTLACCHTHTYALRWRSYRASSTFVCNEFGAQTMALRPPQKYDSAQKAVCSNVGWGNVIIA